MRIARLVVALALAVSASSQAAVWLVCRHTGRVMTPAACPMAREAASPSDALRAERCCDVRRSEAVRAPAETRAAAQLPQRAAAPAWAPAAPSVFAVAGALRVPEPPSRSSIPIPIATRSLRI